MTSSESVPPRRLPAWRALEDHARSVVHRTMRELFAGDPGRAERLTFEAGGLVLDASKNRVTDETISLLCELARQAGVRERAAHRAQALIRRGRREGVAGGQRAAHHLPELSPVSLPERAPLGLSVV